MCLVVKRVEVRRELKPETQGVKIMHRQVVRVPGAYIQANILWEGGGMRLYFYSLGSFISF